MMDVWIQGSSLDQGSEACGVMDLIVIDLIADNTTIADCCASATFFQNSEKSPSTFISFLIADTEQQK